MAAMLRIGFCALAACCFVAATEAAQPELRYRVVDPDPVLSKPARLSLVNVAVSELADRLAEQFSVPAYLDLPALEAAHIAPSTRVNCAGAFASLDEALASILGPAGLGWLVEDGVLVITSAQSATERLDCRMYRLRQALDFEELIEKVRQVAPKNWSDTGGTGAVVRLEPDVLIVLQSRDVHRHLVTQFGAKMRELPHVSAKLLKSAPAWTAQHRALAQTFDCELAPEPLSQAILKLSERGKLAITLDERAASVPQAIASPVVLEGVRFGTALQRLLGPHKLTWIPDSRGLLVTTHTLADSKRFTVSYSIGDLVTFNAPETIVRALVRTIEPTSWSTAETQGKASLQPRNVLEIEQTYDIHRRIEQWFGDLRAARKR